MKHILLAFTILLLLGSCKNLSEVEITQIRNLEFKGFKNNAAQIKLELEIDNPNKMSFTVHEMDLKVFANGRYLGHLQSIEEIKVRRKSKDIYPVDVQLRLANILTGVSMFMAMRESGQAHLKVEGTVKAKSFLWKKQIPVREEKTVRF